jgi:hypothetical protein
MVPLMRKSKQRNTRIAGLKQTCEPGLGEEGKAVCASLELKGSDRLKTTERLRLIREGGRRSDINATNETRTENRVRIRVQRQSGAMLEGSRGEATSNVEAVEAQSNGWNIRGCRYAISLIHSTVV